ncbi:hypothetical protein [Streptomyces sp. NPDC092129]|uniref:hypothetical protein n=1 Tax=Streptomyces sp. NPDC092129 TaxID=3366010 RepID=UPI00381790BC
MSANGTVLPGFVWRPGPLLGLWLWYVPPVAGWWFSRRVVTGRPPSWWALLVSCLPPLLAYPLMAAGGTMPTTELWLTLGLLASGIFASVPLVKPVCAGTIRRWLPTAAALLWLVCVTGLLSRTPIMSDKDPALRS